MQKVIEGVLTNYEVVGKGRKDLVILHGWKSSISDWQEVATELGKRYRVILVDLPGFGASPKPRADWGIYDYGEFTGKFLQATGVKKATILGHSFGGRIAILLASRSPKLVTKLILVDAAGMEVKSLKATLFSLVKPLVGWLSQEMKNRLGSHDYREAGGMRKTFVKVVNQPLRAELEKIQTPTLIIWGDKDRELSLKEARMLHQSITGSVLRLIWGAGHWPHQEKFTDFMRVLVEEGI